MSKASPAMLNLARQLFIIETKHVDADEKGMACVVMVCERLRQPLTKFAGPVGYSSLLSRALALAKVEIPELKPISVHVDGSIREFLDADKNPLLSDQQRRESAGVVIVAHLLGLLDTFIGESLMVTLLSDAWPSESFDTVDLRSEVKS
ncbi:hypothetical protein [Oligoflexus tunisiensis]|uniref:hypothetical protein n=1 Tax=Oligoflexus tunisiensis TaxID=708132 RepID=UPI00114CE875|nr:hypothetical protein [Oligoflexus tunisiensis]